MSNEITNRVAKSGIINLDPGEFYPKFEILELDIKPWLFQGLLLREKDFRQAILQHNWAQYQDKYVAVNCSADAIIPQWAYMLLACQLQPTAKSFYSGTKTQFIQQLVLETINQADFTYCKDGRVIIKGCGDYPIPNAAYLEITKQLVPIAKSIMYGEACSTVPIYKKK